MDDIVYIEKDNLNYDVIVRQQTLKVSSFKPQVTPSEACKGYPQPA